jgi:hypothetical protein
MGRLNLGVSFEPDDFTDLGFKILDFKQKY